MTSNTKLVIYMIGVTLIGIYSFVLDPVVVHVMPEAGGYEVVGHPPYTDWASTAMQTIVYLVVWTIIWGLISKYTKTKQ